MKKSTTMRKDNKHIIISGGGTGGHVFPAISIANALKEIEPGIEILFVGAKGRMEMEKVPKAGYEIKGLPIIGIQRKLTMKNLQVPFKLFQSLRQAKQIIKSFKPDVVVGVGGYASGPVLRIASRKGIPTVIQEQNSYAGLTNRLLAKRADKICVAYDGMEQYFPKEKILNTGNPVRKDIIPTADKREEAIRHFNLSAEKKTILSIGGSLGAGSINNSIIKELKQLETSDIQLVWQCGKNYYQKANEALQHYNLSNIKLMDFINRMDLAYAAADVIISRAGAGTISELALVNKPVILIPSPNVAEDHQTKNARSLADKNAAIIIKDNEAQDKLIRETLDLIRNESKMQELKQNIQTFAKPDSAKTIANEILKLTK
jgi:UDP-N-acetylglucosamine--N-acetylmuramyl-(pentapeptide) pyrophosphoryl-undecaprenol N-acetylglucosamine transferase